MKAKSILAARLPFYSIQTVLMIQFFTLSILSAEPIYLGYSDYHILTDFSFNYADYFREMEKHGINLQRIWVTGYSHVVPSVKERMPFVRRGRKYDLSRFDPEFLDRLKSLLYSAKNHKQTVMLTLFDRWSISDFNSFILTPWYYKNNKQRLLRNATPDFYNIRNKKLKEIQEHYVRNIVAATRQLDPIYEIMNEAAAGRDCKPILEWHHQVAGWILQEFPEARIAVNVTRDCEVLHKAEWVDMISLHYDQWAGDICEAIRRQPPGKTILIDTDGAFRYRDDNRLVKTWLEQTLACGGSFNHKDEIEKLDQEVLAIFSTTRMRRPPDGS